jgi:dihydroxyacid dehydratase/phosphogluconate dehydratase
MPPIGLVVDEQIVNAMVALLATGGSTNHLISLGGGGAIGRYRDRLE